MGKKKKSHSRSVDPASSFWGNPKHCFFSLSRCWPCPDDLRWTALACYGDLLFLCSVQDLFAWLPFPSEARADLLLKNLQLGWGRSRLRLLGFRVPVCSIERLQEEHSHGQEQLLGWPVPPVSPPVASPQLQVSWSVRQRRWYPFSQAGWLKPFKGRGKLC